MNLLKKASFKLALLLGLSGCAQLPAMEQETPKISEELQRKMAQEDQEMLEELKKDMALKDTLAKHEDKLWQLQRNRNLTWDESKKCDVWVTCSKEEWLKRSLKVLREWKEKDIKDIKDIKKWRLLAGISICAVIFSAVAFVGIYRKWFNKKSQAKKDHSKRNNKCKGLKVPLG